MFQQRRKEDLWLKLLRSVARVLSVVSTVVLILFIIGEGFEPSRIAPKEWLGLALFPTGLIIGFSIAWFREGAGGAVTIASLFGFYLAMQPSNSWPFAVFALPGFLFLIYRLFSRVIRKQAVNAT